MRNANNDAQSDREDVRAAAGMQASISSFVLSAALAIIAAEAALVVFFFDKRDISGFGIAMLILSPILVIASFIAGGQGLNKLSKNGYAGNWQLTLVSSYFNLQAIFTLCSALCLLASVRGVSPKSSETSQDVKTLDEQLRSVKVEIRALEVKTDKQHLLRKIR